MSDKRITRRWGQAIRAQRRRHGMSVSELANRVGVSRPTVYDWESGKAAPHPERHVAIAAALDIHPQLLFSYPETWEAA